MFQYLFESAITLAHMPLNYLLNIVGPPVVVLVYHRITSLRSDPELLAVTPDNFRAHRLRSKNRGGVKMPGLFLGQEVQ